MGKGSTIRELLTRGRLLGTSSDLDLNYEASNTILGPQHLDHVMRNIHVFRSQLSRNNGIRMTCLSFWRFSLWCFSHPDTQSRMRAAATTKRSLIDCGTFVDGSVSDNLGGLLVVSIGVNDLGSIPNQAPRLGFQRAVFDLCCQWLQLMPGFHL